MYELFGGLFLPGGHIMPKLESDLWGTENISNMDVESRLGSTASEAEFLTKSLFSRFPEQKIQDFFFFFQDPWLFRIVKTTIQDPEYICIRS